jgi:hypothetical protein
MKSRRLVLRKETLTQLDTGELAGIAGGSAHCVTYTKVPTGCICTGPYPSLNLDCTATRTGEVIANTVVCTV